MFVWGARGACSAECGLSALRFACSTGVERVDIPRTKANSCRAVGLSIRTVHCFLFNLAGTPTTLNLALNAGVAAHMTPPAVSRLLVLRLWVLRCSCKPERRPCNVESNGHPNHVLPCRRPSLDSANPYIDVSISSTLPLAALLVCTHEQPDPAEENGGTHNIRRSQCQCPKLVLHECSHQLPLFSGRQCRRFGGGAARIAMPCAIEHSGGGDSGGSSEAFPRHQERARTAAVVSPCLQVLQ
jgi:hypothetical protein